MSGAIAVREARPDDFDAWLPLWEGYNAFYERAGPTAVPQSMTRLTWQRFFDAYEPMHALVAEAEDGRLVGLVHYLFHRHTTMVGPICYLQDLFTAADAARPGRGAGADRDGLRPRQGGRLAPRLLADPRDERHREAALRPGCDELGLHRLPAGVVGGRLVPQNARRSSAQAASSGGVSASRSAGRGGGVVDPFAQAGPPLMTSMASLPSSYS